MGNLVILKFKGDYELFFFISGNEIFEKNYSHTSLGECYKALIGGYSKNPSVRLDSYIFFLRVGSNFQPLTKVYQS